MDNAGNYQPKELVVIEQCGVFYDGRILKVQEKNGERKYLVHYKNFNSRHDEWLRDCRLQKKQSSDSTPALDTHPETPCPIRKSFGESKLCLCWSPFEDEQACQHDKTISQYNQKSSCHATVLKWDLLESIACSICYQLFLVGRAAYFCGEGHLICGSCFNNYQNTRSEFPQQRKGCPTCKTTWPSSNGTLPRVRAVEKLAESVLAHCPMQNCKFHGPVRDLLDHLPSVHPNLSGVPDNFLAPNPPHPIPRVTSSSSAVPVARAAAPIRQRHETTAGSTNNFYNTIFNQAFHERLPGMEHAAASFPFNGSPPRRPIQHNVQHQQQRVHYRRRRNIAPEYPENDRRM